jgi:hypothetical protein
VSSDPVPDLSDDSLSTDACPELLRDEPQWLYLGHEAALVTRRLRVWREVSGQLVAVVTEAPGDPGTSVTNAIERIIAQIAAEYPEPVDLIEHYLPRPGWSAEGDQDTWTLSSVDPSGVTSINLPPVPAPARPATYDRVTTTSEGYVRWSALSASDVISRLGTDLND